MEPRERCQCLTQKKEQCKNYASIVVGDNPYFCRVHQNCEKPIPSFNMENLSPKTTSNTQQVVQTRERCQCLTSKKKQCKNYASDFVGDNPHFCRVHQDCDHPIPSFNLVVIQPEEEEPEDETTEEEEDIAGNILLGNEPNKVEKLEELAKQGIFPDKRRVRVAIDLEEPEIVEILKMYNRYHIKFEEDWLETALASGNLKLLAWFIEDKTYPEFKRLDMYLGGSLSLKKLLAMLKFTG